MIPLCLGAGRKLGIFLRRKTHCRCPTYTNVRQQVPKKPSIHIWNHRGRGAVSSWCQRPMDREGLFSIWPLFQKCAFGPRP